MTITKSRRVDIDPSVMRERWEEFALILREYRQQCHDEGTTTKVRKFADGFTIEATGDEVEVHSVMTTMIAAELMFRRYADRVEEFVRAFVRSGKEETPTPAVVDLFEKAAAQLRRETLD